MSKAPPSQQGPAGSATGAAADPKKRPPKGHRQKGAGTVVVSKGEVKRDGLEIKEWQQTPKQLLMNYCKAEKRPLPRYVAAAGAPAGKFLMRVILPDPKDQKEKDIVIVPKDTSFDSQVEAEHAVALLALHRVDGTRSHELKLPEPYRSAWLKLTGRSAPAAASSTPQTTADEFACDECGKGFSKAHALEHHKKTSHPKPKKANPDASSAEAAMKDGTKETTSAAPSPSPTPPVTTVEPTGKAAEKKEKDPTSLLELKSRSEFATEHERQAFFEKQRVERERQQRQRRMAENEDEDIVFMSEDNRAAIERVVREAAALKNEEQGENGDADDRDDNLINNARPLIETLVKKMGFSRIDARSAVINGAVDVNSALDWLLVHLPEDRLPAGFDPRGLQLEVTPASTSTSYSSQPVQRDNASTQSSSVLPAESTPNAELFTWYRKTFGDDFPDDKGKYVAREDFGSEAEWKSEWEALESIFGATDARMREDPASGVVQWILKLDGNPRLGANCQLDFRFLRSTYPVASLPIVFVRGTTPALAYTCTAALAAKMKIFKGEPAAYALWDYACQMDPKESHSFSVRNNRARDDIDDKGDAVASSAPSSSSLKKKKQNGPPPSISREVRERQSEDLMRHLERRSKDATQQKRRELPAHRFREEIIRAVNGHRVVIIKGETGCGKTTQVPQFIFEDMIEKKRGGFASLVVTQPRRLAAVSVATRVAYEFGEEEVGNVVGYRVQLESRAHPVKTRVEFVTTGLLLRRMQSDATLRDVTHVLVDEVHERSLDSDFLLALLRECLKKNGQLKVVLMSATMDADRFSKYFGGAPVLEIPGRTFPVSEMYLDDVLNEVPYLPQNVPREVAEDVVGYLERDVDYRFLALCVFHAHGKIEKDGSILVFLSGVAEISKAIRACEAMDEHDELYLLPLHGALSGPDQRKVFERAPGGKRKVVMSTNVAETSVTIDDIVCVIDTGRMKEMRFDAFTKMSSLVDTWVSAASARQRKGRAGRVRAGICYKLFSSRRKLDPDQLAEVHRVPLEQCVLQVASMGSDIVGDLSTFFDSLVEPPAHASVLAAVDELINIGALEPKTAGSLTPLGSHLAKLPMDARLGKMLIFGSLLGVPEEVSIVAAALSRRSPFLTPPPDKRDAAKTAKKELASMSVANAAQSDHLILVAAFEAWRALPSDKERRRFSSDHFLFEEALRDIDKLRREFLDAIEQIGFPRRNEVIASSHPLLDIIAKKRRLIKASLCAGLYPNVVKIKRPSKRYVETLGGALEAQASAKELSFELLSVDRLQDQQQDQGGGQQLAKRHARVYLHPSSINFETNAFNSSWIVFSDLVHTSKPFVRDCTVVAPYGLLLFGGPVEVRHEEGIITSGSALRFKAAPRIAVLVKEVKKLLDRSLADKISNPDMNVGKCRVLEACKRLVEGDGFF